MNNHPWKLEFGDADVRLNAGELRAVYNAPLYLSPAAQNAATAIGVNALVQLVKAAKREGVIPKDHSLGKQAISHVLDCYPTLYLKMIDTCNLINWHHVERETDPPIKKEDIVVCGFRLRDFSKLQTELGLSEEAIAKGAGVDVRLIKSLNGNYRVHLDPVLKIHEFLVSAAAKIAVTPDESDDLKRLRQGKIQDGVAIDEKPFVNIEKIQNPYGPGDVHLLNAQNVTKAPADGHPWARTATDDKVQA